MLFSSYAHVDVNRATNKTCVRTKKGVAVKLQNFHEVVPIIPDIRFYIDRVL
jgi:hypothetical protein